MKDFKTYFQKDFWLSKWNNFISNPRVKPWYEKYKKYEDKNPLLAKVLLAGGSLGVAGFTALVLLFLLTFIGVFGSIPSVRALEEVNQNIASEVFSEDGVLLGKYFIENRLPSELEDISPHLINALISTEDARFFEHGGIDFKAWLRVIFRTILMSDESGGGGSTLSQQLAKNLFPRKRLWILTLPVAKIKEMVIATRLERAYDKNELLALYLNTVPFGDNVFGINVAAKRFFDTSVTDIKLEEAAVLIGMLKANTAYNPVRNPERSHERRNTVLSQMVKYGHITEAELDSLSQLPLELKYSAEGHLEGLATYFREHLRLELENELQKFKKPDGRPYNLYRDGLKIYTTINSKMQQYAEEAVNEHMKDVQKSFVSHFKGYKNATPWGSDELLAQTKKSSERYKLLKEAGFSQAEIDSNFVTPVRMTIFSWDNPSYEKDTLMTPQDSLKYYLTLMRAGFLATEANSGKVLAWVGGINFKYFKYDHVKSTRQVGSTFKPFVYAKALQMGITPCEQIPNEQIEFEDGYKPRNSDGSYGGTYSMRGGMKHSINMVAINLIKQTGIDPVRKLAKTCGLEKPIPLEYGIALGSVESSVYEMTRAFSAFANQGILPTTHYLVRIETYDGKVLVEYPEPDHRKYPKVLTSSEASLLTELMSAVVNGGTGGRLRHYFGGAAAGKTGTTNNNADGWFIGYTPSIVTGAWVGAEQPAVRWMSTNLGQGGATALPICGKFLGKVYRDSKLRNYQKSSFPTIDSLTYYDVFDCPDFISADTLTADSLEMELLEADSIRGESLRDMIQDVFKKKQKEDDGESGENLKNEPPLIGRKRNM